MVHFELQSQYDIVCVSITVDKKGADASRGALWCCHERDVTPALRCAALTLVPLPPLLINTP